MKIAFLDFKILPDLEQLKRLHDVRTFTTIWSGAHEEIDLGDADVVLIDCQFKDLQSRTVHLTVHEQIAQIVARGGVSVVFVGQCARFHLRNLVNIPPDIDIQEMPDNIARDATTGEERSPFDVLFSVYGHRIARCRAITMGPLQEREVFLTLNGNPVGVRIKIDRGQCIYLPNFGEDTGKAALFLLENVLSRIAPHLFYDEALRWLQDTEYLMPSVLKIQTEIDETEKLYRTRKDALQQLYQQEVDAVQCPWNALLIQTGDLLKAAVAVALESLGWNVVDVDAYWAAKQPDRQKEEDLWIDTGVEPTPSKPDVILVEVKSSKRGTASEDDYGAVMKYRSRRMREFKNVSLGGMLVINHCYQMPAALRPAAFSSKVVADANDDGVVLVTTWDLFRPGQRIKAGTITAETARALLSLAGPVLL